MKSQGLRCTNLLHSNVLRLVVSFKLDREVLTGDPIANKGAVLDLEVVSRVEFLEEQPISAVGLDIPRPAMVTSSKEGYASEHFPSEGIQVAACDLQAIVGLQILFVISARPGGISLGKG